MAKRSKKNKSDIEQLIGILEEFDPDAINIAVRKLGLGTPIHAPSIVPWSTPHQLGINTSIGIKEISTLMPLFAAQEAQDVQDILELLKKYLKDPTQIVTGPRSTGDRKKAEKAWKESCRQEGQTIKDNFPVQTNKQEWYAWDHIIDGEITAHITLTWESDVCYIYNADFSLTVQQNDEPEDYGVIMLESYTIPTTPTVERGPCRPCTPTCLRALATVIFYATRIGAPSVSRQINIDTLLCPTGFTDNTNYSESQGTNTGKKDPGDDWIAPPVKPRDTDSGTWGVSRIDRQSSDQSKQYFPR